MDIFCIQRREKVKARVIQKAQENETWTFLAWECSMLNCMAARVQLCMLNCQTKKDRRLDLKKRRHFINSIQAYAGGGSCSEIVYHRSLNNISLTSIPWCQTWHFYQSQNGWWYFVSWLSKTSIYSAVDQESDF